MLRRDFLKVSIGLSALMTLKSTASAEPTTTNLLAATPTKSTSGYPDLSRLLRCIAERETHNRDDVVGPNGELSKYQIGFDVWKQHVNPLVFPFKSHCRGVRARNAAIDHVVWLSNLLTTEPTPYSLAYCWRGGLESWTKKRRSASQHRVYSLYASDVFQLYHDRSFAS